MTNAPDTAANARLQDTVLDAAIAELAATDISSFTLDGVVARAGVPAQTVRQIWPNAGELLNAALRRYGAQHYPIPDTGSFRGDLMSHAASYAENLNTATGRRLLHAVMIRPQDWDLSDTRPAFLEKRALRMSVIVERAITRGECLVDVDPDRVIDLLRMSLSIPVLFYDRPVDHEDCVFAVDILLDGLNPRD